MLTSLRVFYSGDKVNLFFHPILEVSHSRVEWVHAWIFIRDNYACGDLCRGLVFLGMNYPRGELSDGEETRAKVSENVFS